MSAVYRFEVRRDDFSQSRIQAQPETQLLTGQVRLQIEQFALTANNITYAVAGDMLGYWQFFPAEEGWGCIPVWATGLVTESLADGVKVGQRYYGYFPMANELIVEASAISERGMLDGIAHRKALPVTYNQYMLMSEENGFPAEQDAQQLIYRPLFTTAFLIDDFFADQSFFAAEQLLIASASSKTAIATAFCLAQREGLRIIGLTSAANKDFVLGLGLYDAVYTYQDLEQINNDTPSAYIDMSGNRGLLERVHQHFSQQLQYSCAVGITHYDETAGVDPASLPGAVPQMFFAPTQLEKRNKEWGSDEFSRRLANAWQQFITIADQHIQVVTQTGASAVQQRYEALLGGGKANEAYICKP